MLRGSGHRSNSRISLNVRLQGDLRISSQNKGVKGLSPHKIGNVFEVGSYQVSGVDLKTLGVEQGRLTLPGGAMDFIGVLVAGWYVHLNPSLSLNSNIAPFR